jgi:hypothetical protein
MFKKLTLAAAAGAGYVLGAKAGTQRYEQIVSKAREIAGMPAVQSATATVKETAAPIVDSAKTTVSDKVSSAADKVTDKVSSGSGSGSGTGTATGVTLPSAGTGAATGATPAAGAAASATTVTRP